MELNHQIRLCRPFPFRFGFRAVVKTVPMRDQTLQILAAILQTPTTEPLSRRTAVGIMKDRCLC
jgi:hypothetical protein